MQSTTLSILASVVISAVVGLSGAKANVGTQETNIAPLIIATAAAAKSGGKRLFCAHWTKVQGVWFCVKWDWENSYSKSL